MDLSMLSPDWGLGDVMAQFHFLRPYFLLLIVPLTFLTWKLYRLTLSQSGWRGILPEHLYKHLITSEASEQARPPWRLFTIGWLLVTVALAGPTWKKLPQPVYQVNQGKVIVIDMSLSMRATDIGPDRLTRAIYKAIDLANSLTEGELGLVAYAGDAFVISPLTADVQNITALLPGLSPEIMPVKGSEPEYGLSIAMELLSNAGYTKGDIYWITDGIDLAQVAPLRTLVSTKQYSLYILGVGTEKGAPIKLESGDFLKDANGAVVIPQLRESNLAPLANATSGKYVNMQPDDADIRYLTERSALQQQSEKSEQEENEGDQWQEMGPYLLLLLLPIAAYSFRRGILLSLFVVILPFPSPSHADWWDDLWLKPDQQGDKAFNQGEFDKAASAYQDPMWKGAAHYRNGEYEKAAETYSSLDTDIANYNLGNALAQTQQLQAAIDAYDRALELNPDHQEAAENKKLLEELLEQQQEQQEQQQQQQNSDNDSEQNQEQKSQDQQNQQSQDQQNQEQENQDQQNQQSQDQQSQDQQNSDSQQDPQSQESDSKQEQQQNEEERSEQQQSASESEQQEKDEAQQMQQTEQRELTEEEKEQMQKMQKLLRKIPDDPAFLLQRKMQLEQQRRKRQQLPGQLKKDW